MEFGHFTWLLFRGCSSTKKCFFSKVPVASAKFLKLPIIFLATALTVTVEEQWMSAKRTYGNLSTYLLPPERM